MMSEPNTTRPDRCPAEGCPACGRLPGEGCGRDDLPGKRIGCWLLGGPLQLVSAQSKTTKLTPIEQAMNWERMSGERLSDAERKRIMDGGEFTPPHLQTTAIKIRGFSDLSVGWHYGEGIPPPPLAIELALKVEQMLRDCGYSQTDAFPGCGGEIQVTGYHGGCSVTIEVTDEGRYKEAESNA